MKAVLRIMWGIVCLAGLAHADAPLVFCTGQACGGDGPRDYAYEVDSVSYPMIEFIVGTNDLDPSHYTDVLVPPGWNFAVEQPTVIPGMRDGDGIFTPHGMISPADGLNETAGWIRWWAGDDIQPVEEFTFGFNHWWAPEDMGWTLVTRREGPPPEEHIFTEFWDAPVGAGNGPVHGPYSPPQLNLGPEELIGTEAGTVIEVPGYSVPSFAHWDEDGLRDLVVGEGGYDSVDQVLYDGKIRVYLNVGSLAEPLFEDYFYAQTASGDIVIPPDG